MSHLLITLGTRDGSANIARKQRDIPWFDSRQGLNFLSILKRPERLQEPDFAQCHI